MVRFLLCFTLIWSLAPAAHGQATRSSSLALGNASNAKTDPLMKTNYLLRRTTNEKFPGSNFNPSLYDMSYNSDIGTPNWVSWHLSSAWLGGAARPNDFRADPTLPAGFTKVASGWYDNTGFDQGHMCNAEDRGATDAEISATFYMSNMVPQSPNNNRIGFSAMEAYCRTLAGQGNEMYIVAGPWGIGGTGSKGFDDKIPNSGVNMDKVRVPSHIWKVVLVLPNGTNDLARVSTSTRTIAIWMPNDQSVTSDWGKYRVSVDFVEQQTGFNFFRDVSDAIEAVIESKVDTGPTK